jgi:hypothetical protein
MPSPVAACEELEELLLLFQRQLTLHNLSTQDTQDTQDTQKTPDAVSDERRLHTNYTTSH